MAKTCPKRFDVECEHIFDCKVPRLALRCRYLEVEVESTHVFMGNPMKNCTVICRRTGRPFNSDELNAIIDCTESKFKNGKCPRASEPDE